MKICGAEWSGFRSENNLFSKNMNINLPCPVKADFPRANTMDLKAHSITQISDFFSSVIQD